MKFFLATGEFDAGIMKIDMGGTDGLVAQIGSRRPIGSGDFKMGETGRADTFALTLDAARGDLIDFIAKGNDVFLLVASNDDVATTYFGAGPGGLHEETSAEDHPLSLTGRAGAPGGTGLVIPSGTPGTMP